MPPGKKRQATSYRGRQYMEYTIALQCRANVRLRLARQKYRAGGVAQYVLRGRAQHHLDYAAVPVSADEQQVGLALAKEAHDLLVRVAAQQLERRVDAVGLEVVARLADHPLAHLCVASDGYHRERCIEFGREFRRGVHRLGRPLAAVVGERQALDLAQAFG